MRFLRLAVPDVEEVAGSVTSLGTGLQLSRTGTPVDGATWKSQPSQSPLGRPGGQEWVTVGFLHRRDRVWEQNLGTDTSASKTQQGKTVWSWRKKTRHIDQGTEWTAQKYSQAFTVALSKGIKNTRWNEDSVYKQCEENWSSMCWRMKLDSL